MAILIDPSQLPTELNKLRQFVFVRIGNPATSGTNHTIKHFKPFYLNPATKLLSVGAHPSISQLVQPCPCSLVAPQTENALQPKALSRSFWLVTNQMAANHILSGIRVRSNMVPAVTETSFPHCRQ
jgi:hypothetical protein